GGPDGSLYVASYSGNSILRFDGTTGAPTGTFVSPGSGGLSHPTRMTFGPDGNLSIASEGTISVLRYNGTTGAFLNTFVPSGSGGLSGANGVTFGPDGNLYDTSGNTNQVLRYNGTTGAFLNVFATSGLSLPTPLVFGPDGNLYVTNVNSDSVSRYNGVTGAFLDFFAPSGGAGLDYPDGLTFGPDGNLYVSSGITGQVLRYDGSNGGPGDVDSFTLDLDANQTLALRVTSSVAPTLTVTHSVLGPISLGPDLDPGPRLQYQTVQVKDSSGNPVAVTVTISVQAPTGLTTGSYSIQATLNAQFDTVSDGSAPAQSLAPSTLDVEPGPVTINRAAALGSIDKAVARILSETEGVTNDLH